MSLHRHYHIVEDTAECLAHHFEKKCLIDSQFKVEETLIHPQA